jgi:cell wall-associated NlpC family hydrolase
MYIKKNRQLATWVPDYKNCSYVTGGNGPCGSGFDCSGLQYYMYNRVGYSYADDTAQGMYNSSTHISSADALPGDWVFFDWGSSPPSGSSIDHTGCYIGGDAMVEASSSAGLVKQTSLDPYWDDHALYGHRYGANERF